VSSDEVNLDLMRGRLLERMFGEREAQPRIDRFELLGQLGRGGMGTIYRAFDPKLAREVALKLVSSDDSSETATRRMLREARGLASLAHPNVVPVFEVGPAPVGIWIAMEYVPGQTLRGWMQQRHDWRTCLSVLIAAGRGLAAAHAAGLMHRDFKPENVMVGSDGRARVVDFGLARSTHASEELLTTLSSSETADEQRTLEQLSRATGGTPAYMAPEAFGGNIDARVDQWAFCVTAFEVLTGGRPFHGPTLASLMTSIQVEPPAEFPRASGVPGRVRAAIVRGLSKRPEQRWPDMTRLLDELERVLERRRLRWAAATAAVAASVVAGSLALARSDAPVCPIDAGALAGVWDEEQRAALRSAFAATHLPFAEQSTRHIEAKLDRWTDDWVAGQREACVATRVEALASDARLDQRTACYARKRDELGVLVSLLVGGDTDVVGDAADLVATLPDLGECSDEQLVEGRFPIPSEHADAIRAAQARVAELRVLAELGRLDDATRELAVLERETATLAYPPLALELRALASELAIWRGDFVHALEPALALVREAEVLELDELVARERVWLADRTAAIWGQPERERDLVEDAAAALARLGREPGPLDVDLLDARGRLAERRGDFDAALSHFEAAALLAESLGDLVRQTRAGLARARIHAALGHDDAARAELDAAAAATLEQLGPGAPLLASIELDRALLAMQRGELDAARDHVERARAIHGAVFGEQAPVAARAELVAARLALMQGDLDAAADASARAARPGVAAGDRAAALEGLGVIAFLRGDIRGSVEHYRAALALREQQLGDEHPELAILHSNLGESLAALHEYDAALLEFDRCIALLQRTLPDGHLDFAFPYKGRGQVRLALGSPALARLDLERALALHEQHPSEPLERADVEFSLARALVELGEREAGEALARTAQTHYLEVQQTERADEIAAWLATQ
jgi:hypothetical protein